MSAGLLEQDSPVEASLSQVRERLPTPETSASAAAKGGGTQILLFDAVWVLGALWVYGGAAVLPGFLLQAAWRTGGPLLLGFALPVAYFLFLLCLIIAIGCVTLFLPPEPPGLKTVFKGKEFAVFLVRWGLDAYLVPPLRQHIQLLTATRYLYFRAMGMTLHWTTHISPGARVISPSLLRLGRNVFLGEGTYVSGHLSVGDRMMSAPVIIHEGANVGAHSNVGPGVQIGARTKVGAMVDVAPDARIGQDVHIFPRCHIGMGAVIGDGVMLDPRTYIPSYTFVPAGEHWAGDPGRCVGKARGRQGKAQKKRSGEIPVLAPRPDSSPGEDSSQ